MWLVEGKCDDLEPGLSIDSRQNDDSSDWVPKTLYSTSISKGPVTSNVMPYLVRFQRHPYRTQCRHSEYDRFRKQGLEGLFVLSVFGKCDNYYE